MQTYRTSLWHDRRCGTALKSSPKAHAARILGGMIRFVEPLAFAAPPPIVPGWATPREPVATTAEAAFLAGAALNTLDNLVRAAPPWAGAWRQRLALKAAAAAVRRLSRREDEAALRDAWHLRPPGADPGPAGRILAAWRRLAERSPDLDEGGLRAIAELLGTRWSETLAAIPTRIDALGSSPAPFAGATILAEVLASRPDAELLAFWFADLVFARQLRWLTPVPLLIGQIHTDAFRGANGRGRIAPAGEGFERAICLALAQAAAEACRTAAEIARRAVRLAAAAPKLRAKGAGGAIQLLLEDDAVSGSLTTPNLTRCGSRRLFERLATLEAVRELTGRSTFRLYWL
jgi:hypothetical protein